MPSFGLGVKCDPKFIEILVPLSGEHVLYMRRSVDSDLSFDSKIRRVGSKYSQIVANFFWVGLNGRRCIYHGLEFVDVHVRAQIPILHDGTSSCCGKATRPKASTFTTVQLL
jgi:hypothetical protein